MAIQAGMTSTKKLKIQQKELGGVSKGPLQKPRLPTHWAVWAELQATHWQTMIIPIWVAAGHTSSLVSSSAEEMDQLERLRGKEAAAHRARAETEKSQSRHQFNSSLPGGVQTTEKKWITLFRGAKGRGNKGNPNSATCFSFSTPSTHFFFLCTQSCNLFFSF